MLKGEGGRTHQSFHKEVANLKKNNKKLPIQMRQEGEVGGRYLPGKKNFMSKGSVGIIQGLNNGSYDFNLGMRFPDQKNKRVKPE